MQGGRPRGAALFAHFRSVPALEALAAGARVRVAVAGVADHDVVQGAVFSVAVEHAVGNFTADRVVDFFHSGPPPASSMPRRPPRYTPFCPAKGGGHAALCRACAPSARFADRRLTFARDWCTMKGRKQNMRARCCS